MNKNITKIEQKRALLFLFLQKLLLDILYIFFVSKLYAFYHFFSTFSIPMYITSWVAMFVLSKILIKAISRNGICVSSIIILCIFSLSCIPFLSMMYCGYDISYVICNLIMWSMIVIFYYYFARKKIVDKKPNIDDKSNYVDFLFIVGLIFSLIVIFVSGYYSHFRLSFNLDDAYIFRTESDQNSLSFAISYLFQWSRIVIPVVLCFSLLRKKYLLAIYFLIIQLLNFGYDGMRLTVLITGIAIIIPIISKTKIFDKYSLIVIIPLALSILSIASLLEHLILKSGEIDRLITFRTYFLPNLIESWFFDFFKTHEPDYFRASFLRYLGLESPYSEYGLDYLISGIYFGDYSCRGNSGMIADAISNLGYPGLIIMPLTINVWLLIFDKTAKGLEKELILLLGAYFGYCFTNNFMTIILFTNGGLIILLILYFRKKIKVSRNRLYFVQKTDRKW